MNEYNGEDFIISTMRWSFSRLNSFDSGCKYGWYKHYIECEHEEDGFFSQFGRLCHECLEKYAKGEIPIWELSQYYEDNFCEVVTKDAPFNKTVDIKESYFQKGLDYFDNIDLPIDKYEVIGVEKQVEFELEGYPFIGFIDLLLKDPADGKLVMCDHKSSTIHKLKSGGISKKDEPHFLEFKRQQYLYSIPITEEYGEGCIKALSWNLYKDRDWITIPFDNKEFEETKDWAVDVIHRIEKETEWEKNISWYFCKNVCGIMSCEEKG